MSKEITTIAKNDSLTLTKESFVHSKSGELYESLWLWSNELDSNVFWKIEEKDLIPKLLDALQYHITKQLEAEKELSGVRAKIEAFALSFGFEEYPESDKDFMKAYR